MLNAFHTQKTYPIPVFGTGINTLQMVGSTIEAEIANIEAELIQLISDKNSSYANSYTDGSGILLRSINIEGQHKETVVESAIQTSKLIVNDQDTIKHTLDSDQLISRISSEHPELSNDQIELIQANLTNKEWDDKITTLSETGAIIVQAVVTYLTAGAGAGAGAALAEATNTALNATLQTAIDATIKTMIREATSQAVTAALTGSYDFDLEGLATNALKSGVTAGMGQYSQELLVKHELTGLTGDTLNLAQKAATQTALYGGDFKENLTQTLVTDLAAKSANVIGDKTDAGSLANISSHAVLGCGAASAQGQDCASGAAGGALSATLAPQVGNAVDDGDNEFTKDEKAQIRLYTQVLSTLALSNTELDLATADQAVQNEVNNNYLSHVRDKIPEMSERERYDQAVSDCSNGDPMACQTRDELRQVSQERDQALAWACGGGSEELCRTFNIEARTMGNRVLSTEGGYVYANSPEHYDLNTSTIGSVPENTAWEESFDGKQAQSLSQSLPFMGGVGSTMLFSGLTNAGKMAAGFSAGSSFDAAGQLSQNGPDEYRPMQTIISGTTTAVAAPYASANIVKNMFIGGSLGGGNTAANNFYYNESKSILDSAKDGAIYSGLGTIIGSTAKTILPKTSLNQSKLNPNIPLNIQVYLKENPINELAGKTVNQAVSHIPTFLPKSNDEGNE